MTAAEQEALAASIAQLTGRVVALTRRIDAVESRRRDENPVIRSSLDVLSAGQVSPAAALAAAHAAATELRRVGASDWRAGSALRAAAERLERDAADLRLRLLRDDG